MSAHSSAFFDHAGGLLDHASSAGVVRRSLGPDVARTLQQKGYQAARARRRPLNHAAQVRASRPASFHHTGTSHAATPGAAHAEGQTHSDKATHAEGETHSDKATPLDPHRRHIRGASQSDPDLIPPRPPISGPPRPGASGRPSPRRTAPRPSVPGGAARAPAGVRRISRPVNRKSSAGLSALIQKAGSPCLNFLLLSTHLRRTGLPCRLPSLTNCQRSTRVRFHAGHLEETLAGFLANHTRSQDITGTMV